MQAEEILCAVLSSSGVYWKTISIQNGQLQEIDRNKGREHSENHGQIHATTAVSEDIGAHMSTVLILKVDVTAMLLCLDPGWFRSWVAAPDWLNLSHMPLL